MQYCITYCNLNLKGLLSFIHCTVTTLMLPCNRNVLTVGHSASKTPFPWKSAGNLRETRENCTHDHSPIRLFVPCMLQELSCYYAQYHKSRFDFDIICNYITTKHYERQIYLIFITILDCIKNHLTLWKSTIHLSKSWLKKFCISADISLNEKSQWVLVYKVNGNMYYIVVWADWPSAASVCTPAAFRT